MDGCMDGRIQGLGCGWREGGKGNWMAVQKVEELSLQVREACRMQGE